MKPIYINGHIAPDGLTTYDISEHDIDGENAGRGESGHMQRERVRADIADIKVGWTNITTEELTQIKTDIKEESFPVKFFDGEWKEETMYAGDRTIKLKCIDGSQFWDISFSLIMM